MSPSQEGKSPLISLMLTFCGDFQTQWRLLDTVCVSCRMSRNKPAMAPEWRVHTILQGRQPCLRQPNARLRTRLRIGQDGFAVLALSLPSSATLGKLVNLSEAISFFKSRRAITTDLIGCWKV